MIVMIILVAGLDSKLVHYDSFEECYDNLKARSFCVRVYDES